MTEHERRLRDAFLAECWRPVPELPREERAVQAALAQHTRDTRHENVTTP